MNYCSIDEAWGNNILKDSRKKRKTKRLYTSQIPPHIYDKSYEEEGHDNHCSPNIKNNFTVKNKNRFDKSRGPKDIHRPKRSSRVNNINISYDQANQEYKKYKKESKRNTKNQLSPAELLENEYTPVYSNNMDYIDGDEVAEYSPIQENDMELNELNQGSNLSSQYTIEDNDRIQQRMFELQKEQSNILEEQKKMVENQQNNVESFDNYYDNNTIEPFENNSSELDMLELDEESSEQQRINKIKDVEPNDNAKNSNTANKSNNKSKKPNFIDNLIKRKNKQETDNESETDTDSDSESEDELTPIDSNNEDLDYRINTLNRNVNLIIKKMNDSQIFDEESQENIHDLILFVLFGIFIIFVLDTIYRFGKNSKK